MGSMAPYGYRAYKLPGVKDNSLHIEPEEAKVVQMIYDMYGKQGMGYNAIAYALNDMHIPARKGEWSQTSIVNILTNEVYLGKIRWRRESVKRVVRDGFLAKTHIPNDDEEKNRLWKLVLRKVTAYRTPEGELSVHIYPKLPKVI